MELNKADKAEMNKLERQIVFGKANKPVFSLAGAVRLLTSDSFFVDFTPLPC